MVVQRLPADTSSSVALLSAAGRTLALVADEDQDALATFDLQQRRQVAVTVLGAAPSQIRVLEDGRIAATLKDANRVALFELTAVDHPLKALCSASTPSEPFGLAEWRQTLLVTSAWDPQLSALNVDSLRKEFHVTLEREPRAVLVEGDRAFVSHAIGSRVSVVDLAGQLHQARPVSLDLDGHFSTRKVTQGFALAREHWEDATRIFAPGAAAFSGDPVVSHGYGRFRARAHLPVVAVLDPRREVSLTRFTDEGAVARPARDHVSGWGEECILPRASAARDGRLYVACQGTDSVVELDARAADPIRVELTRYPVPPGPTGLAVSDSEVVVWSQFARELALIDLSKSGRPAVTRITSWTPVVPRYTEQQLRGRELFNRTFDLRISIDGRACASCHPDGRDDGLTWSTSDGPRQSIMLAGRLQNTAPFGWFGTHRDLDHHLSITLASLGGRGFNGARGKHDAEALKAWLEVMPAPTRTETPKIDPEFTRGAALFFDAKTACSRCHLDGQTDRKRHDVKSGSSAERSTYFDTPNLAFVGATGPYFHDGRYATLAAMLRATDTHMGDSSQLSDSEISALVRFLQTLGGAPAKHLTPSRDSSGWRRDSRVAEMSIPKAPPPRSLERLQHDLHPPQPPVRAYAFKLADVPLFDLPPADVRYPRPTKQPSTVEAGALRVTLSGRSAFLAVPGHPFGWLQAGDARQPLGDNDSGNVSVSCPLPYEFYTGLAWQTLKLNPDGTIALTQAAGWLNRLDCRAWLTRQIRMSAVPLVPGLVYAFRTRCAGCQAERLHVITPDWWHEDDFMEDWLDPRPGESTSFERRVSTYALERWERLGVRSEIRRPRFGVQITWAADDPTPIALAYAGEQ
ncbi:MAG: hypothetical protein R3B07_33235 [Polyangiaceae bacterium]